MKNYKTAKWSMWGILAVSFLLAIFLRLSTSVISDNLQNELGFTQLQISNISTLTLYSYAFMQIPLGLMIDKYGPRKISSIGMIIAGLGTVLFGTMNNIYLAYISRIMIGAGTAGIILCIMKIQVNWFKQEEFTKATSRMSLMASLGAVCATFPLAMLNNLIGWRNNFIFIGSLGIIIGIIIYIKLKDTPTEYGFEVNISNEKEESIKLKDGLVSVFKNKATWYNSFIMFSLVGITTAFSSLWIVPYISDVYKVETNVAAFIASFLTYGMVVGSVLMNSIYSRIKEHKLKVIRICGITNIFIWTYIVIINNVKPPIMILPVLFFIVGCLNMSHLEAFNDVKRKNKEKYSGLSTSVINTSEFIGSGIINMFIALVIQSTTNITMGYKFGFIIFIFMNIIAVIASTLAVRDEKNNKLISATVSN